MIQLMLRYGLELVGTVLQLRQAYDALHYLIITTMNS